MISERYAPVTYALFRIVFGYVFMLYGLQKTAGWFGGQQAQLMSLQGAAGVVETVGGLLIMLGLFTRVAAFLASGEMAIAYFYVHVMQLGQPPMGPGGHRRPARAADEQGYRRRSVLFSPFSTSRPAARASGVSTPSWARKVADMRALALAAVLILSAAAASAQVRIVQTNSQGDNIHLIDPATRRSSVRSKAVPVNHGAAAAPDGSRIYISSEAEQTLHVVDAKTLQDGQEDSVERPPQQHLGQQGWTPRLRGDCDRAPARSTSSIPRRWKR
jgi:putative oxidoreductase